MNRALPLLMCALLAACSAPAPRAVPVPPPARVSTTALAAALGVTQRKTASAGERVKTVTQTVERIITTADPATAAELATVRDELFKVTVDLRDAQAATAVAETERAHEQRRADDLHAWGVAQQAEAAANADGWRTAEAAAKASKGAADKWATAFHKRTAKLGLLAAAAGFFLGIKLFPVPPVKWWCGLGFAAAAAAAAATFL